MYHLSNAYVERHMPVPSEGKLLSAFIVFMASHPSLARGSGSMHIREERPKSERPVSWVQPQPFDMSSPFCGPRFPCL